MTIAEFLGCSCLAFGPALAIFTMTIAHDPIRIIIMVAAAFFWLCSFLLSSIAWLILYPLHEYTIFGLIISVILQEACRFLIYKILRKTEHELQEVSDSVRVAENKHILAYVSGFGFGLMSTLFALVNNLADSVGPATVGLYGGSDVFLLTSSVQGLCLILLHTFWSVVFFNACDNRIHAHMAFVVVSHLLISILSLLNQQELYLITITPSIVLTIFTGILAFKVAGGSWLTFKRFITCK